MNFWEKLNIIPLKYHLRKLEIRSNPVNIPHNLHPTYFSPLIPQARRENVVFPRSIIIIINRQLLEYLNKYIQKQDIFIIMIQHVMIVYLMKMKIHVY